MSSIKVNPMASNSVQRVALTMIMMTDAALGQLKDLGYERGFDDLEIEEHSDFPVIKLDGKVVFLVVLNVDPNKGISFDGEWLFQPPRKRFLWLIKPYRWILKKLTNA